MKRDLRLGQLELVPIDGNEFLVYAYTKGSSDEIGSIGSQYEESFKNNSEDVEAFGLVACGRMVGVVSNSISIYKDNSNKVAARLDLVITDPDCRGLGIGALLVSSLFLRLVNKYQERLISLTTIAAHPAVLHCVKKIGFKAAKEMSKVPVYSRELSDEDRGAFLHQVEEEYQDRISRLKLLCIKCQDRRKIFAPWCVGKSA